jgi:hypothetical protein
MGDDWRDDTARAKLHGYADWLRGTADALWCDVVTLAPRMAFPWRYTAQQASAGTVWECGAVWLHCAGVPNGEVYPASVHADLRDVLNTLKTRPETARYTLLVAPEGMAYDRRRLGGDHHVAAPSGRRFTLSVRKGKREGDLVLLAIAWS